MQHQSRLLVVGIVLVLLAFFGGAMLVELRGQRQQGIQLAENVAQTVAQLIKHDIEEYRPLPSFLDLLDDPRHYRHLDEMVGFNLRSTGLQKIKFYNDRGILIYADKPELVGQDHSGKADLQRALNGQPASTVVDTEEYENAYGVQQKSSLIETYLPVRDNNGNIRYAVEIYQNFDPMQLAIHAALWRTGTFLGLMAAVSFAAIGYLLQRLNALGREKEMLESLLPICSFCKKIRSEEESDEVVRQKWVPLEQYFQETREIRFSHGLCQECLRKHYGDLTD